MVKEIRICKNSRNKITLFLQCKLLKFHIVQIIEEFYFCISCVLCVTVRSTSFEDMQNSERK